MQANTNFERGDIVYVKYDAEQGNLVDVTVLKIDINIETPNKSIIQYLVSSENKYNGLEFHEEDLMTLTDAKIAAALSLNVQIQNIDSEINNL